MRLPPALFERAGQKVTLERWLSSGAWGDIYAAPVELSCFRDDGVRLARDRDGQQVASTGRLYLPTGTQIAVDDRMTVDGVERQILQVLDHRSGKLGLPDHVEVILA